MCQTTGCCRGGKTFICSTCKTTAKGWDVGFSSPNPRLTNKTAHPRCPRCRQPMKNMGMKFRPQRKRKWKK